jgi:hypothetical protein
MEPMFFAIQQAAGPQTRGRAVLYATDTGPFSDETWAALDRLAAAGVRFDAAVIDSTIGIGRDSSTHMNLRQMAWHQGELARRNLLTANARRLAHHFSHNGTPPHEELEAFLAPQGIAPAYDGLVIEL